MESVLLIVFLVVALALVGVILLQQGKGAGMGASFGAGASGTVFGAPGSSNVLTKATTVLAIIFFGIAMALGYIANDSSVVAEKDLFDELEQQKEAVISEESSNEEIPSLEKPVEGGSDIPEVSTPEQSEETGTEIEDKAPQSEEATTESKSDETESGNDGSEGENGN
ncbi:preprotein translocase subunit SecG [Pleionea sediminis]|uniref:preprotein translocase subunit SecG n=1 Tax=Pleionea sediminis TaxID=2569479 RepID=UPI001185186D|nr:preprotein translocase subunit SecG [Pleionea sediminis]